MVQEIKKYFPIFSIDLIKSEKSIRIPDYTKSSGYIQKYRSNYEYRVLLDN